MPAHFSKRFFEFFRELALNNDREWFAANKDRYIAEVEEPMLRFIVDVGARLPEISANFVADPRRVGGSLFRIYRDTRFAKDKSPYKTWAAAHFKHRAGTREVAVPGFYVSLAPEQCWAGGGMHHPDAASLKAVRDRIVAKPSEWARVLETCALQGESLKRVPTGYDPAHRFADDLRRTDLYCGATFTERQVVATGFLDAFMLACANAASLLQFETKALGLKW